MHPFLRSCLLLVPFFVLEGRSLMCVCSTRACQAAESTNCNTTNMCYTQVLYVWDGTSSTTRGCINSKSSLLCENKPPAIEYKTWPFLACCNTGNLCNKDLLPSPGSSTAPTTGERVTGCDLCLRMLELSVAMGLVLLVHPQ